MTFTTDQFNEVAKILIAKYKIIGTVPPNPRIFVQMQNHILWGRNAYSEFKNLIPSLNTKTFRQLSKKWEQERNIKPIDLSYWD